MIPPQQFQARLADRIVHNDKFEQYKFEIVEPHQMTFEAGQYISIKASERGDRRSYSITSNPNITHGFELLIDTSPQGVGTKYLQGMKFGDTLQALGPLGRFTITPGSEETELALVGTGSGIAPFRSMVLDLLQTQHDQRQITLYWGMRFVEQLFWEDEFQELSEAFPNFHFHPVISKAMPEWPLCRGRVTDCLRTHQQNANTGYYLCGNPPMLVDTIALLNEMGVPANCIHSEKFTSES